MQEKPLSDQYFQVIQDDLRWIERVLAEDLQAYKRKFNKKERAIYENSIRIGKR